MNSLIILTMAFLFGLVETAYFGWNMFPKSEAEVICDGIALLIAALALVARPSTRGASE